VTLFRKRNERANSRLLPAVLLLLSGCASIPDSVRALDGDAAAVELHRTPFFAQERYQCGPAALTTVLTMSGVDVALQQIVDRVYLPAQKGSLQFEMLAATRTSGRLPYLIDGTLSALRAELAAGRPVVVLQNLGVAAIPRWHYAVVIGIDPQRNEVILRSGTDRRRTTATNTFLQTWRRGDYWAMVVLRPDEMPALIDQSRYFAAIAALEQAQQLDTAALAWQTALARWPDNPVALFGLGNVHLAAGEFSEAEAVYRALLEKDSRQHVVRNNLALALARQRQFAAALEQIALALAASDDLALTSEFTHTRAKIEHMQAGIE